MEILTTRSALYKQISKLKMQIAQFRDFDVLRMEFLVEIYEMLISTCLFLNICEKSCF